jgi:hypothetical protein
MVMTHKQKASLTLTGTPLLTVIPFALLTVASPAWATYSFVFAQRLQGPFLAVVRAGFHPFLLSVSPVQQLLVLFTVFINLIFFDYMHMGELVKTFRLFIPP